MSTNLLALIQYVLLDFLKDILYFPVWWYSKGLVKAYKASVLSIKEEINKLALKVWITNLFTPMFGQYDWQGRIISFFLRIFILIGRLIILFIWSAIILVLFLIYVFLPLVIIYQMIYVLV